MKWHVLLYIFKRAHARSTILIGISNEVPKCRHELYFLSVRLADFNMVVYAGEEKKIELIFYGQMPFVF